MKILNLGEIIPKNVFFENLENTCWHTLKNTDIDVSMGIWIHKIQTIEVTYQNCHNETDLSQEFSKHKKTCRSS